MVAVNVGEKCECQANVKMILMHGKSIISAGKSRNEVMIKGETMRKCDCECKWKISTK